MDARTTALPTTSRHLANALSEVDRGVDASLELRVAQHLLETARSLLTRTFAYCFAYEDGIAFSKRGLQHG